MTYPPTKPTATAMRAGQRGSLRFMGWTFPSPPNMPHPGLFDYEEKIQTETLSGSASPRFRTIQVSPKDQPGILRQAILVVARAVPTDGGSRHRPARVTACWMTAGTGGTNARRATAGILCSARRRCGGVAARGRRAASRAVTAHRIDGQSAAATDRALSQGD